MDLRPFERDEIILNSQHRWRVDGLAFEDALDQFATFGQAEDLWQGPCGCVVFQTLNGAWLTGSACRGRLRRP